ncbi:S1 RNA-binding domain-containing protein [Aliikangiella sp. IMCC44632]
MTSPNLYKKGNFFKAKITKIEPSLEASFVDFGAERHGYLPLAEIEDYDTKVHKKGAFIIVSISQLERGQKGAVLKAHKEAPKGITIHELYQDSSNKLIVVIFSILVVGIVGAITFSNR